jgi:tetratricopeptide (TPR) repeat protein
MLTKANEHLQAAEKAMKTSVLKLKFSPDYMIAASEYTEAAQVFSSAGKKAESKSAWIKAAECRLKENDHFSAARCYEGAEDFDKSAECFSLAGKSDACARVLLKKAESSSSPSDCFASFEKVIDLYVVQDTSKNILAVDVFRQFLPKIADLNDWKKYGEISSRFQTLLTQLEHFPCAHKEVLTQVILALKKGSDTVKADKILEQALDLTGWISCNEYRLAEDLVLAFKDRDSDLLTNTQKKQAITFLRPEIARIVKSFKIESIAAAGGLVDETDMLK